MKDLHKVMFSDFRLLCFEGIKIKEEQQQWIGIGVSLNGMVLLSPLVYNDWMNKKKIETNQLKKIVCRGKKIKTINVKYETVLAYFKQKDYRDLPVFTVSFLPLINDLLNQLAATQLVDRLHHESREDIKVLPNITTTLKLQTFDLKALSKEYPITELCSCLYIESHDKRVLNIQRGKLMSFFKHLRVIYSDLSDCAGDKIIIEASQLRILYELFLTQWNKNEEKGKMNSVERLQRKIVRSLYFLGVLIENNILEAIEAAERRKKEEESDLGTKSQHKKNIKGINQQVSTVHSFASLDPSNLSVRLKSENSQEEMFPIRNNLSQLSQYSQYSEKSEKILSKTRYNLWDKAEIHNLSFKISPESCEPSSELEVQKYEINYLSNDVENILIEKAFNMQKFTDSCYRNIPMSPYQYCLVDYSQAQQQMYQYENYYNMGNYYNYMGMGYPNHYPQSTPTYDPDDSNELFQLKRSLNLVQTRKKDKDRYQ